MSAEREYDLFDSAVPPAAPRRGAGGVSAGRNQTYSVAAVNALAREVLEGMIPPLWVRGEVTGWKRHSSGHCYFSLRDAAAQLRCVMFRTEAQRLPTDPAEGMEVRGLGTVTLYERRGEYQFVVRELEGVRGGGLWRLAFERLRTKLEAEGLLAAARKRPLPRHPAVVAVVTSPVGAALQDILHIIERRAPWTRVVLAGARVQGEGAADDITRAIRLVDRWQGADVLIVGRGGGAVEDLWAFNEEAVARAMAACRIPVISAVGHEVDVTIADLVADARAPTPSAAAELAVPDSAEVRRDLRGYQERLAGAQRWAIGRHAQRLVEVQETLVREASNHLRAEQERLRLLSGKLEVLSPLAALRRGYAVARDARGRLLRRTSDFIVGEEVRLRVSDGSIRCRTEGVLEERTGDVQP